jgi:hypothetical protein
MFLQVSVRWRCFYYLRHIYALEPLVRGLWDGVWENHDIHRNSNSFGVRWWFEGKNIILSTLML